MGLIIPNKLVFIWGLIAVNHFDPQDFNESGPVFLKKGGLTLLE